jgi:hypothetical protein
VDQLKDVLFSRHDDGNCGRCGFSGPILHFHMKVVEDCISSCRNCATIAINQLDYIIARVTKDRWAARQHRNDIVDLMSIRKELITFATEKIDASTRYTN